LTDVNIADSAPRIKIIRKTKITGAAGCKHHIDISVFFPVIFVQYVLYERSQRRKSDTARDNKYIAVFHKLKREGVPKRTANPDRVALIERMNPVCHLAGALDGDIKTPVLHKHRSKPKRTLTHSRHRKLHKLPRQIVKRIIAKQLDFKCFNIQIR
jgi:hypothetical protein